MRPPASENMLESKIFGHAEESEDKSQEIGRLEWQTRGYYTWTRSPHIPLVLQAKLIRLLEHREFERVVGAHSIRVNVRLIASTKYDLAERVVEETFLGDLYDQLNAFPIGVPPLRERRDDIPSLARYFVQKFARRINKHIESIPAETMSLLMNSAWPGNVRQLENLIERSVLLTEVRHCECAQSALNSD